MIDVNFIMNLITWVILIIGGLLLRSYVPSYLKHKGANLATKEDIKEITEKVEAVKAEYARQLELDKDAINLMEKRRDLSAKVVDLINRYKELPPAEEKPDEEQLRRFEQDYYKLVPWIPTDILKALNSLFSKSVPAGAKPDLKDVIVAVRRAILKTDSGDFTGADIVHFVGFRKKG
jgi:predicted nuclease with TOPRIM domain